jgi:hypothetical protein
VDSWASSQRERCDRRDEWAKGALLAVGAAHRIAPGQTLKQSLPGFAHVGVWGGISGRAQEQPGSRDELGARGIGLQPEVPDSDKAVRQDVPQESPHEIRRVEGELSGHIAAPSIAIAEGHAGILERHEALVADGDAMGVAAEVTQHLGRAGHGSLAVDDPLLGDGLSEQTLPHACTDPCRSLAQRAVE